jgi:hypothetical protein
MYQEKLKQFENVETLGGKAWGHAVETNPDMVVQDFSEIKPQDLGITGKYQKVVFEYICDKRTNNPSKITDEKINSWLKTAHDLLAPCGEILFQSGNSKRNLQVQTSLEGYGYTTAYEKAGCDLTATKPTGKIGWCVIL